VRTSCNAYALFHDRFIILLFRFNGRCDDVVIIVYSSARILSFCDHFSIKITLRKKVDRIPEIRSQNVKKERKKERKSVAQRMKRSVREEEEKMMLGRAVTDNDIVD